MPNFKTNNKCNTVSNCRGRTMLLVLLFIAICTPSFSQVLVISSFSPTSGPVGSTVTINGNNFFGAAPVVYFGADKATVISQSSTQIRVTVPAGANYQPITVTTNFLTAYSEKSFIVTFNPSAAVNAQTFGNKIDFTTGAGGTGSIVKDLDGDGKNDVITTNGGQRNISILRNTSSSGAVSFAQGITFPITAYPLCVASGDLDGDGKPDIVVTDFGTGRVNVFLNNSTVNNISLIQQTPLQTGSNPFGISIADFDGDGRPDIVVANEYNSLAAISVYRNITTSVGSVSFAPKIDLPAGLYPRELTTADIDNDGKPDIIVANQAGISISVFRNTSANGNISFAPKFDLAAQAGSSPESVAVGDFNSDGKLDIAVANNNSPGFVSIFENSSVPAALAFQPRQDFATGNYPYSIASGDVDGDGKPDIVVSDDNDNTVSVLINSSSGNTIVLKPHIDYATGNYPQSANIADVNGDGKPDIITGNDNANTVSVLLNNLLVPFGQVIDFPAISSKTTCDADFSAGGTTSNNTIPLTYISSNTAVATISPQGTIHITGAGTTTITVSQAGDDLYTPANPQPQILTVNSPVIPIVSIAADPTSLCTGMTVTYTATVNNLTDNLTYQWQVNGSNTGTNSSTFSSNQVAATDLVKCIVTNNSSCPGIGTSNSVTGIRVDPYVSPSIAITPATTGPFCSGAPISFTAVAVNGGTAPTYQWQVNNVNAGNNSSSFISTDLGEGDLVTCTLTNNGGACLTTLTAASNSITVNIRAPENPAPSVTVAASTNGVYYGVPIKFTATPSNATGTLDYQWQINGVNTGTDNPVFFSSTLNDGDLVSCILSIKNNCTPSVASQPVRVSILQPATIHIPNAFTPNGDNINDQWDIPELVYFPNCLLNIYTRYGSMIFRSRGYNSAWDGSFNGKVLPTGTYYYIIDL
ncbi:MAG: FG-GAP-like repeat-containing protein, partial [Mucilaginibacter sp.]